MMLLIENKAQFINVPHNSSVNYFQFIKGRNIKKVLSSFELLNKLFSSSQTLLDHYLPGPRVQLLILCNSHDHLCTYGAVHSEVIESLTLSSIFMRRAKAYQMSVQLLREAWKNNAWLFPYLRDCESQSISPHSTPSKEIESRPGLVVCSFIWEVDTEHQESSSAI